jgi:tetratricopeptide (TPR) repeat protein
VTELVAELAVERQRLDLLDAGDTHTSVRAVMSWSYRHLDADAARVFRMFGVHGGNEVDLHALCALLGADDVRKTRRALEQLERAHLIDRTSSFRYRQHDLLRAYAIELADGDDERHAALRRLLDYSLHAAATAMEFVSAHDADLRSLPLPRPHVLPPLTSPAEALRWLDTERATLVHLAERVARSTFSRFCTDLSALLWRYFDVMNAHHDARRLHRSALIAARDSGDRAAEGIALRAIGLCWFRRDRHPEAVDHLERALACHESADDGRLRITTLNYLGVAYHRIGRIDESVRRLRQAITLSHQGGHRALLVKPMNNLGFVHLRRGEHEAAWPCLQRALAVAEEIGNRPSQAHAHLYLAWLLRDRGSYGTALDHAHRAVDLTRALGMIGPEGTALHHIGTIHRRLGDCPKALSYHRRSLERARLTGDAHDGALALNGLAEAHSADGDWAAAAARHEEALTLAHAHGARYEEARAQAGLGDVAAQEGDEQAAVRRWQLALDIYDDLSAAEAEALRAKLAHRATIAHRASAWLG